MRFTSRSATLALLASSALAPASAWAGGFSATRFGGEHGHAATDDPTAVYFNPAGLAYGHGTRGFVEGLFAYRSVDYTRDPDGIDNVESLTPDEVAANSGTGTLSNLIISPFIGVASDLGVDGLGVGFGIYAPFGGQTSWDKNSAFENDTQFPGAVDGPARWAAIEGEQRSVYFSLGAGWRTPSGKFAAGAAINVISSSLNLVRARNLDGTDTLLTSQGGVQEGRALLDLTDLTFSAGVGFFFNPTDCSRVGISYQAQPGFGEMTLDGTLTNKYGATDPFTVDVQMRQKLPDSIRIGGVWRAASKLRLHGAAEYWRWSQFKDQCLVQTGIGDAKCVFKPYAGAGDAPVGYRGALDTDNGGANVLVNIPRDWNDMFSVRVGGSYDASDELELNAGVMFDGNAVPDETLEPALIDANKIIGQIGARYDLTKNLMLTGTFGYVAYLSRSTTAHADELDLQTPNRNPDMAGDYSLMVAYLLFGVGVQL
jgi:long-chain fatty acid transport protein